jgi:hypothetical protein
MFLCILTIPSCLFHYILLTLTTINRWPEEAAYDPIENPTVPPVHAEDPTAIHVRGICETDDMAQTGQTIQS